MVAIVGTACPTSTLIFGKKEFVRNELISVMHSNGLFSPFETKQNGSSRAKSVLRSRQVRAMASEIPSAPKPEKDPKKRIVITGMGIDTSYDTLLEGDLGDGVISPDDRFYASPFSQRIAGQIPNFSYEGYIDEKTGLRLDDCLRNCLAAGKKALEESPPSE